MTSHTVRPVTLVATLIDEVVASTALGATRLVNMIVLEMRRRRAARDLRMLDEHMLADIGLRRSDIENAVRLGRVTHTLPTAAG